MDDLFLYTFEMVFHFRIPIQVDFLCIRSVGIMKPNNSVVFKRSQRITEMLRENSNFFVQPSRLFASTVEMDIRGPWPEIKRNI